MILFMMDGSAWKNASKSGSEYLDLLSIGIDLNARSWYKAEAVRIYGATRRHKRH